MIGVKTCTNAYRKPVRREEKVTERSRVETGRSRLEGIIRVEEAICAALIIVILGLLLLQVAARFLFNSPYVWTEELARFGLIWLTFIGAGFVMARGKHVTVDVVSQFLGARSRMALDIVSSLVTIAASLMLLPASFRFTVVMNRIGSPATDVPMSVVYAAGLTGFGLLALHCLVRLVIAVRRGPDGYADEDIVEHIAGADPS